MTGIVNGLEDSIGVTNNALNQFTTFVNETNRATQNAISSVESLTGQVMDSHLSLFQRVQWFLQNLSHVGTNVVPRSVRLRDCD